MRNKTRRRSRVPRRKLASAEFWLLCIALPILLFGMVAVVIGLVLTVI